MNETGKQHRKPYNGAAARNCKGTLFQPEEKNGRFYCQPDLPGNPQRLDIAKLEKDGLMESREIYYPKNW